MYKVDISKAELEDVYINEEYDTTTLYFTVHNKENIISISVEFPTQFPDARYASAMYSKDLKMDDGSLISSDWEDIDFPLDVLDKLISEGEGYVEHSICTDIV